MLAELSPPVLIALLVTAAVLLIARAAWRVLKGRNSSCNCAEKLRRKQHQNPSETDG